MLKVKKYLIFAHYHSSGLIRKDLIKFLKESKKIFNRIIFVTTKVKQDQLKKLPKNTKIIKRQNIGYDFYSYKIGLKYLNKILNKNFYKSDLFFANSSILYTDPRKLLNKVNKVQIRDNEFWGISRSFEMTDHIQSYFFFFSSNLLEKKNISDWWKKIQPLKTHFQVMFKYELGLSKIMLKNNIHLKSIYKKNINLKTKNLISKIRQRFSEIFFKTPKFYKKDPTNYFWKDFYKLYGIVKIKLIKKKDKKFNLDRLYIMLSKKKILFEALNN